MTTPITSQTKPIAQTITDMNISHSLYDTGDGEGAYLMRDEDADELITRTNGPIEIITIHYEVNAEMDA